MGGREYTLDIIVNDFQQNSQKKILKNIGKICVRKNSLEKWLRDLKKANKKEKQLNQ